MNDIYKELQGVATGIFAEFGQGDIRYISVTPGTGPADSPGPPRETLIKVNAVARGVQFRYIDGSNIVRTDQQITMPVHPTVTPDMNGFVSVDGVRYKIVEIVRKPAAGTPIAYTIIFRK